MFTDTYTAHNLKQNSRGDVKLKEGLFREYILSKDAGINALKATMALYDNLH